MSALNVYEFKFIEYICNKLNFLLGAQLYRRLVPEDIERAHILYQGETSPNSKQVVIVRFVRRVVRNNVFFNRKWLKTSKDMITDHLTKANRELLSDVKSKFGKENAWSTRGVVKAKLNNNRIVEIRSEADLHKFTPQRFQYRENASYRQNTNTHTSVVQSEDQLSPSPGAGDFVHSSERSVLNPSAPVYTVPNPSESPDGELNADGK